MSLHFGADTKIVIGNNFDCRDRHSIASVKCPARQYDFLHCEQVWDFALVWVSMRLFRVVAWANELLHWTQVYDISLVWVTICFLK